MKITSLLVIASTVLLFSSCSKSSTDVKTAKKTVKEQIYFSLSPLAYPSTHTTCEETTFDKILNLNVFNAGESVLIEELDLNFSYIGLPAVKNSTYLTKTVKSKRFVDTINLYVDELGNTVDVTQDSKESTGENLVYCQNQELERETLEHVALDVISTLDKSIFMLSTIGLFEPVAPIEVFAHPTLETTTNVYLYTDRSNAVYSQTQTMTDNAFYYNNGLYFIPHSEDYKNYVGDRHVDFWEIPFVASHEYGHHLFNTFFYGNEKKKSFRETIEHVCFTGRELMMELFNLEDEVTPRDISVETVLGAFNEGFADLFAQYSLDKASSSLVGVVGFETEREVDSLFLASGRAKVFTTFEAEAFFLDVELERRDPRAPFQEIHTIGAVFASIFNQVLEQGELSHPERLRVVINWLKIMNTNFPKNASLTPKEYTLTVVNDFISSVVSVMGTTELNEAQQEVLKSAVPFYF